LPTWPPGWLDAILIGPYRWPADPVWGWWLGTLVLALWSLVLGELTLAVAYRVNRHLVERNNREMIQRQRQSLQALRLGDQRAYKGLNKLANEAFGKGFFLQIAMGASSLWPAFFALAWLQERFQGVPIPLPALGLGTNFVAGFIGCYLLLRVMYWRIKVALRRRRGGRGRPGRLRA